MLLPQKAVPKFKVPGASTVSAPSLIDTLPTFSNNVAGALHWFKFGLDVIPIVPYSKRPPVTWEPWLNGLSPAKVTQHWSKIPEHEVGFIVGDEIIVLDADSPESIVALTAIEKAHGVTPSMVVKTTKGEHHFFKRAKGTFAKSDSHSTKDFPDRLDVKTGRALIILPPSTGKVLAVCDAKNASELTEVGQDFIDAIFHHNGRHVPRQAEISTLARDESDTPGNNLGRLKALLAHISPDCGYEDWLRVLMAIYHETGDYYDNSITGCPYVVPNPKTKLPFQTVFCSWNTARKEAGMPELRMHDLRHSFASFLINSNHSLYVVQKLLGHTQIKTTAHYSHLDPGTLLNAADAAANAAGMGMVAVR